MGGLSALTRSGESPVRFEPSRSIPGSACNGPGLEPATGGSFSVRAGGHSTLTQEAQRSRHTKELISQPGRQHLMNEVRTSGVNTPLASRFSPLTTPLVSHNTFPLAASQLLPLKFFGFGTFKDFWGVRKPVLTPTNAESLAY